MPTRLGAIAVAFSKERFTRQNWVGKTRQPWEKRKVEKGSKRRRRRHVLVDSGRLKRSIRVLYKSHNYLIIGTDVPYAKIHNEGGTINKDTRVRRHTRKAHTRRTKSGSQKVSQHQVQAHSRHINIDMPERRFIGESALMVRRMERDITKEIKNALNTF